MRRQELARLFMYSKVASREIVRYLPVSSRGALVAEAAESDESTGGASVPAPVDGCSGRLFSWLLPAILSVSIDADGIRSS